MTYSYIGPRRIVNALITLWLQERKIEHHTRKVQVILQYVGLVYVFQLGNVRLAVGQVP